MITKIILRNYKSFSNVTWNLSNGLKTKKLIALYGENGAGKSNMLTPLFQLGESVRSFSTQKRILALQKKLTDDPKVDVNENFFKKLPILKLSTVKGIFENIHQIGSEENTEIEYYFDLPNLHDDGKKITGNYKLVFSPENELIEEKFVSLINKRNGVLFDLKLINGQIKIVKLNNNAFSGRSFISILKDRLIQFWGSHTFFSILLSIDRELNNNKHEKNYSATIGSFLEMLLSLSFRGENFGGQKKPKGLLGDLSGGTIRNEDKNILEETEKSLNLFFTSLYTDIKRVYYKRIIKGNDIEYHLIVKKMIFNKIREVSFKLESNGTRKLLKLFPLFSEAVNGNIVVVDEIDTGIHDLLMSNLIDNLQEYIKGQLIFSTHNTTLLQVLPRDGIYVIQEDYQGNKRIVSFNEVKNIKPNNNLQKLYLSGYFSGVPFVDEIEFNDIFNKGGEK